MIHIHEVTGSNPVHPTESLIHEVIPTQSGYIPQTPTNPFLHSGEGAFIYCIIQMILIDMVKFRGREDYPFYFGASPKILGNAYDLRHSMTNAESILWERLRRKQILGYRFRRQHPVNEFIVDFFCYVANLVIEIDGNVHDDPLQKERDIARTKIL